MNIKTAINYYLQDLSKYLVAGALLGLIILWGVTFGWGLPLESLGLYEYIWALAGGFLIGISLKAILLLAVELVMRANAASAQLNAKRAKTLGDRLKMESKDKIRNHVTAHAKAIILQMHGKQPFPQLEDFFQDKIEEMAEQAYFKIDRHLNYLTDRAIHGDIKALKRLYQLYRRNPQERAQEIERLLDRIINEPSEVEKLKDKIDTLYDYWKFKGNSREYGDETLGL